MSCCPTWRSAYAARTATPNWSSPKPASWPNTPTTPAASSPSNGCSACCTAYRAGWPGAASGSTASSSPTASPPHFADYALIFTEDSRFAPTVPGGTGTLVASFNANLLDLPIRRDEAALTTFLDGAPGKITMLYRRDREMVIRVRDLLRAALPATLSLDDIARRLYLSPRTIHRRLEEEGSSFRAIKDALRRDMALSRMTKTRDSIAKVAADLGYADPSAFYRAFVEWTGMAPAHYRRRWRDESQADRAGNSRKARNPIASTYGK